MVHIQSGRTGNGTGIGDDPRCATHGLDVTTETYPYTAGMTAIDSAVVDELPKLQTPN